MSEESKYKERLFSGYFYNNITFVGVILALGVLACEFILFVVDFNSGSSNRSLSVLTYLMLPPFLLLGLILIPIGARYKQYKDYKGIEDSKIALIVIDPSLSTHRRAIRVFIVGTIIYLVMSAIGCYKAYQYMNVEKITINSSQPLNGS